MGLFIILAILVIVLIIMMKKMQKEEEKRKAALRNEEYQQYSNNFKEMIKALKNEYGFSSEDFKVYHSITSSNEAIIISVSSGKYAYFNKNYEYIVVDGSEILDVNVDSTSDTKMTFTNDIHDYNRRVATTNEIDKDIYINITNSGNTPYISFHYKHNMMSEIGVASKDKSQWLNRANEIKANLLALKEKSISKEKDDKGISSLSAELQKINKLREDGILSEEEYKKAKEKVLA